ncbi:CGNR zinc finger domain-containing protein [Thermoactinospora rubra]|uniref:CGNR zinc finger domain-containing protein n=1 Tax=Thermoactinospora rubra TaxID=1088767 RepID=UPI001F0B3A28|nr:CGNR zinc finger domain-containing protein [Thermoactinospora rubra]
MNRWVELAVVLVNTLAITRVRGRTAAPPADGPARLAALEGALEGAGRRPWEGLTARDADRLAGVAAELRPVFCAGEDLLRVAAGLNEVLVRHGAVPNLHGEGPVLAFHREGSDVVEAVAADCATALAMVIGVGQAARLSSCSAGGCEAVFFDTTRNASRRFCSLACQNRAKASAYRARRAARG